MEKKVSEKNNLIVVAQFGKTRGINGKINIKSFFSNSFDILNYRNFFFRNLEKIPIKLPNNSTIKLLLKLKK